MSHPTGKPTLSELRSYILRFKGACRGDVILGPEIAVDSAVVDCSGVKIAFKGDPITGAITEIGRLAVIVPSNDVAAAGGSPRWLTVILLLPTSMSIDDAKLIMDSIDAEARRYGIAIVGGHTEFTGNVVYPIVCSFVSGVVDRILDPKNIKPGDLIVVTKKLAMEATVIIASDLADDVEKVFGRDFRVRCLSMRSGLSVIPEARAAAAVDGVVAMHDLTEGGLLAGIVELAEASNLGFTIYEDRIPVAEETRILCDYFGLDPLKAISSGSLLIAVRSDSLDQLRDKLSKLRIEYSEIGFFTDDPRRREIVYRDGSTGRVEPPDRDDLWRLLDDIRRS
ncbi:MAG: AIR synthase family protein [Nitrososphaerota archaeon]|nr:AIR synthase family protein [Candidatus Bathyarchaeota archaeon]MCX8162605.1 AIR synthase family protein [Candidatus Bathyarchaeota archaeon]MDW8061519.1 AIR synthase family protein [Nitrososphaerota archaeon]